MRVKYFILSVIFILSCCGSGAFAEQQQELSSMAEGEARAETDPSLWARADEAKIDRFIIKYKSSNAFIGESTSPNEQAILAAAEEKVTEEKELRAQRETALITKLEAENRTAGEIEAEIQQAKLQTKTKTLEAAAFSYQPDATVQREAMLNTSVDVIETAEFVEPESFIAALEETLNMSQIEYIQPDYSLELANEEQPELSLELISEEGQVEKIDKEPTESQQPGEENQGEMTQTASPAPEPTPEPANPLYSIESDMEAAWQSATGSGVSVAVIDTGIDITHPDLSPKVEHAWDMANECAMTYDSAAADQYYHGTHVAGIIAKTAPDAKIIPIKAFENGKAYTSDLIKAIAYAEEQGASIVNCSWGSKDNNQALREAMEQSGLFFVCAAGNNRVNVSETPIYPASFGLSNSISVTSLNSDLGFSYYSNYGTQSVDIAIFGRDIQSAKPGGGTVKMNGTSMSAGYASAAAAMVKQLGETNIKDRLKGTSARLSNLQAKVANGNKLSLANAAANVRNTEIVEVTPADDFDVDGYQRTPQEDWELFCSLDNVQVAAGGNFCIALKANGTVWAWGKNDYGQLGDGSLTEKLAPVQIVGLEQITSIVAGHAHGLALKADGTVWAWGWNVSGEIGDGTTTTRRVPTLVPGPENIIQVGTGSSHCLAVTESGTVWAWGANNAGQLGDENKIYARPTAEIIDGLNNVTAVTGGGTHSMFLKSDGTLMACGQNLFGQLGNGTKVATAAPTAVLNLTNVSSITGGLVDSYAVKTDGSLWYWGNGKSEPQQVMNFNNVKSIKKYTSDRYYTLALKEDNTTWEVADCSTVELEDGSKVLQIDATQRTELTNINKVAAGANHYIVLNEDGKIWTWGDNTYGQIGDGTNTNRTVPVCLTGQINTFTDETQRISGGEGHSIFLKEDNTIWAWGKNDKGQLGNGTTSDSGHPVKVNELTDVVKISSGKNHNFAIKADGSVWAWGENTSGQLGDATTTQKNTPVQLQDFTEVNKISAGTSHSIAVKTDGTVWSWGLNSSGQLGDGTTTAKASPVQLSSISDVVKVSAGGTHSLALKTDGTVYGWGTNTNGQLGNGTMTNSSIPVQVSGITNIVDIAAGDNFSMALKDDGTVYSWGQNDSGQLGDGTTVNKTSPGVVTGIASAVSVKAGKAFALVLKTDGSVLGWGNNSKGQLGENAVGSTVTAPVTIQGLSNITRVSAGSEHGFACNNNEKLLLWGNNKYGQLGDGTETSRKSITEVVGLSDVVATVTACDANYALKSDGTVWFWGSSESDDSILDNVVRSSVPINMGLTGITAISALQDHVLALKNDGTVWAWGSNTFGELGNPLVTLKTFEPVQVLNLNNVVAVSAGNGFSLALKADGTVWSWGDNSSGMLGNNSTSNSTNPVQVQGLSSIIHISAGGNHCLAIKEDGTIWGWGDNYNGQLGMGNRTSCLVPTQIPDFTDVSDVQARYLSSFALKNDGTVWIWGDVDLSTGGAITNKLTPYQMPELTNIQEIYICAAHNFAKKADGGLWAWGYNEYGQLGNGSTEEAIFTPFRVYEFGAPIMMAGWYNTIAVSEDGYVQSLGLNNNNQLGDGRTFQRETPYEIDFTNLDKDDNSFDMATVLAEDTIMEDTVNYIGDQDWFSFVPAQTKNYEVLITSTQAAAANIYEAAEARPVAVQSRKQVDYQSMTAGQTYYFKVFDKEGLTGGYSIVVKEANFSNAETETNLNIQENELITITLAVGNVRNINHVEFEVIYNTTDLQPISFAALNYEPVLTPGVYGPVEILTVGQGSVTFRINAGIIPENMTWSGVANVLKFSAKKTGTINLQAKLRTVIEQ